MWAPNGMISRSASVVSSMALFYRVDGRVRVPDLGLAAT